MRSRPWGAGRKMGRGSNGDPAGEVCFSTELSHPCDRYDTLSSERRILGSKQGCNLELVEIRWLFFDPLLALPTNRVSGIHLCKQKLWEQILYTLGFLRFGFLHMNSRKGLPFKAVCRTWPIGA